MFFWCSSGEDGTRIEELTESEVQARLNEIARGDRFATFLKEIPEDDKGCWMHVPEDAVVIVKGEIVVPKEKTRVTEYEL